MPLEAPPPPYLFSKWRLFLHSHHFLWQSLFKPLLFDFVWHPCGETLCPQSVWAEQPVCGPKYNFLKLLQIFRYTILDDNPSVGQHKAQSVFLFFYFLQLQMCIIYGEATTHIHEILSWGVCCKRLMFNFFLNNRHLDCHHYFKIWNYSSEVKEALDLTHIGQAERVYHGKCIVSFLHLVPSLQDWGGLPEELWARNAIVSPLRKSFSHLWHIKDAQHKTVVAVRYAHLSVIVKCNSKKLNNGQMTQLCHAPYLIDVAIKWQLQSTDVSFCRMPVDSTHCECLPSCCHRLGKWEGVKKGNKDRK